MNKKKEKRKQTIEKGGKKRVRCGEKGDENEKKNV